MLDAETRQQSWRAVQEMLHGLIRSRCVEFGIDPAIKLPCIEDLVAAERQELWFPIDGMYGGFKITLVRNEGEPTLLAESWSRVMEGSEMRHSITATQVLGLEG